MLIYTVEEIVDLGNHVLKVFDSHDKAEAYKESREREKFYADQIEKYGHVFFEIGEYDVE